MITTILSMLSGINSSVLTGIGVAADLLGIGAIVYGLLAFLKSRRKYKQKLKRINELYRSDDDVMWGVLVISIPGSIKGDVVKFLKGMNREVNKGFIKEISTEGYLVPEENYEIGETIREYKQEFSDLGIDRLMLFVKGPVYVGVIVGSILTNWKPVDIYHFTTVEGKSTYQRQETLTRILKTGT